MQAPPNIFDPSAAPHRLRRAQADAMFLQIAARDEISERLKDINRSFTDAVVVTDFPDLWADMGFPTIAPSEVLALGGSFDLIIHAMAMHRMNDPLGQMIQCLRALRPDGLFLASAFGGETLSTLRQTLTAAEAVTAGGASPRVHPMIDIRDCGALMQRAGFTLPVVDALDLNASYANLWRMMRDIRAMGEANALAHRIKTATPKALFDLANDTYPKTKGRLHAEFQILFLAGWAAHDSQQKPLRPGSGKISLVDALDPLKTPSAD